MTALAIHGGTPAIPNPAPHYVWPRITQEIERVVIEQLHRTISIYDSSGIFSLFEDRFRTMHARKYALLTSSGTAALHSAFEALDLRPGDEVIVPSYTFFATVSPLAQYGVYMRQVDCDASGNIDPSLIPVHINERTRAIVITHMWGHPCDVDSISRIANSRAIPLVEDCSHAHGARMRGQIVGMKGDICIWSLQGQKIINGGEGGILLTDTKEYFDRALLLGHYNKRARQQVSSDSPLYDFAKTGFGLKLRAHPLAIAIANCHLDCFEQMRTVRAIHAQIFRDALTPFDFISLPFIENTEPAWYAFMLQYDEIKARVPIAKFYAALVAEGLLEIDRPTSTSYLASYDLFTRTHLAVPRLYERPMLLNPSEMTERAMKYVQCGIKLPVWAFEDERIWVERYAAGMHKVCRVVKENPGSLHQES